MSRPCHRPAPNRALHLALLLPLLAACSRDVWIPPQPPPPGPGTIQGRVAYAVPGQSALSPAVGASVTVLGTSLGSLSGADGRFQVAGVMQTRGALLVQVDLDHDGTPDKQTVLRLEDVQAGPGKDVALGDVVVVENARIRGRATKGNVTTPTSGHGGITVFVPEGPFLTVTGDDGSYVLNDLPEGRLSLTYFRDGYAPQAIDGVQLGAGQDYQVRDVVLSPLPPGGPVVPGSITGQVTFQPATTSATSATVTAYPVAGAPLTGHPATGGTFTLNAVDPGLYRVEVALTGYTTAVVANVMVVPGQASTLAVALTTNGVTVTPPPPPTPGACIAGAACTLPNACQVGQVSCADGQPVCGSAGFALDGIPCGPNQVCQAGACTAVCTAGAACRSPSDPCKQGAVSCSTGVPVCVAGAASLADGAACGLDQVCHAGACTACAAGQACAPTNPCDSGLTECSTGVQTCHDTGIAVTDGTSCGSNLSCNQGSCSACQAGKACAPQGFPCHTGTTSCSTGLEVCADTGRLVADGASCGQDKVCRSGGCTGCVAAVACSPANRCHSGSIACGTGLPVCVDQQLDVAAGQACGSNQVCDGAGTCVACAAGSACTPANPCHAGQIACATGAPVCADTTVAVAAGSGCGADHVCTAGGACVACIAGTACTPAGAPCHAGVISCATGGEACVDTTVKLADGASCGSHQVCGGGTCTPCTAGAACDGDGAAGHAVPSGPQDQCTAYVTACSTGTPACAPAGPVADGTSCPSGGTSWVCRSGTCSQPGWQLRLVSAPAALHGLPYGGVAVTLQLADVGGSPVLTPTTVTFAAPPGAVAPAPAATSFVNGLVTFTVTLGRAVGPQHFTASAPGTWASLDFVVTADRPPDGTILTLASTIASAGGIAAGSDGTIFFSEGAPTCVVKAIDPQGVVRTVAGSGSCGFDGDNGAPTMALSGPSGLAYDPVNALLYIADTGNGRVRVLDPASGGAGAVLRTVGGGGALGDGNPPAAVNLVGPARVAVTAEAVPSIVVAESNGRVRKLDFGGGTTSTLVPAGSCAATLALVGPATAVASDEQGKVFVAGPLCGTETGGQTTPGVVRVVASRLERVAGIPGSSIASGLAGTTVTLPSAPTGLAFDRAALPGGIVLSNLYLAGVNAVPGLLQLDGPSGKLVAQPAWPVRDVAVGPGGLDLYGLGTEGTPAVSWYVGGAPATAARASLANATVPIPDLFPGHAAPAAAKLLDGAGKPLVGFPVSFTVDPTLTADAVVAAPSTPTGADGRAVDPVTVGQQAGLVYGAVARFRDLHGDDAAGSPVSIPLGNVFAFQTVRKEYFDYSGAPVTWVVPAGVGHVQVKAWGAAGGGTLDFLTGTGGGGGFASAILRVQPGDRLTVDVGQGGQGCRSCYSTGRTYGGGGGGSSVGMGFGWDRPFGGAAGGGLSMVLGPGGELIVAGGGGGAGMFLNGGGGGGTSGANGAGAATFSAGQGCYGGGGTDSGGGAGGPGPSTGTPVVGQAGSYFQGGDASPGASGGMGAGGGGGGYFGGGGGGAGSLTGPNGGGGGGGSGHLPGNGSMEAAVGAVPGRNGDGDLPLGVGYLPAWGAAGAAGNHGRVVLLLGP